jgi:hypothetical protein
MKRLDLSRVSLSEPAKQFINKGAQREVKLAAARGTVPLMPAELLVVLYELLFDDNPEIRSESLKSLGRMPQNILSNVLSGDLPGPVLDFFGRQKKIPDAMLEAVIRNRNTEDETIAFLAGAIGKKPIIELIAEKEDRIVRSPGVFKALIENSELAVPTRERLVHFASLKFPDRLKGMKHDPSVEAALPAEIKAAGNPVVAAELPADRVPAKPAVETAWDLPAEMSAAKQAEPALPAERAAKVEAALPADKDGAGEDLPSGVIAGGESELPAEVAAGGESELPAEADGKLPSEKDSGKDLPDEHAAREDGIHAATKEGEAAEGDDDEPLPEELTEETEKEKDKKDEKNDHEKLNLYQQIQKMGVSKKIKLAMQGNKEARGILIKDSNKLVSSAVIKSPRITENEIMTVAQNKGTSDEILRMIANKKEWMKNYGIKLALVNNPKTPAGISVKMLPFLNDKDVKDLSKSKGVPAVVAINARRIVQAKESKKG